MGVVIYKCLYVYKYVFMDVCMYVFDQKRSIGVHLCLLVFRCRATNQYLKQSNRIRQHVFLATRKPNAQGTNKVTNGSNEYI